ncbi:hypothetical protein ACN3XK_59350 [Actinomadura welshii]
MDEPELHDDEDGLPHSCYLLEFSVEPGGARLGDVHVGSTLGMLRQSWSLFGSDLDDYLVLWYGAVLHLWVVQEGAIVQGIDLHPYLRSGDPRCDAAVPRIVEARESGDDRWDVLEQVIEGYDHETAEALPLLAHVLELQDRAEDGDKAAGAELHRILADAEAEDLPESYGGVTVERLELDWDAIAGVLPPLREPLLADTACVGPHWGDDTLRERSIYLRDEPLVPMHIGLNDLENDESERLVL